MPSRSELTYLNLSSADRVKVEVWAVEGESGIFLDAAAPHCGSVRLGLPRQAAAKMAEKILAITGPSSSYRKPRGGPR